jgi:AcrR family transcriptional regulator
LKLLTPRKRGPLPKGTAEERVVLAARELFERRGVAASGVDQIARVADVTKMTIYGHFGSKDDLIAAVARRISSDWLTRLARHVAERGDPRLRIAAVFEFHERWMREPGWRGSPLANLAAELPDPAHPARKAVAEHSLALERLLERQAAEAGIARAGELASALALLLEGAMARAQQRGDPEAGGRARVAAAALVRAAERA